MWKRLLLLLALTSSGLSQPVDPVPITTPYTKTLLRAATSQAARDILLVSTNGDTYIYTNDVTPAAVAAKISTNETRGVSLKAVSLKEDASWLELQDDETWMMLLQADGALLQFTNKDSGATLSFSTDGELSGSNGFTLISPTVWGELTSTNLEYQLNLWSNGSFGGAYSEAVTADTVSRDGILTNDIASATNESWFWSSNHTYEASNTLGEAVAALEGYVTDASNHVSTNLLAEIDAATNSVMSGDPWQYQVDVYDGTPLDAVDPMPGYKADVPMRVNSPLIVDSGSWFEGALSGTNLFDYVPPWILADTNAIPANYVLAFDEVGKTNKWVEQTGGVGGSGDLIAASNLTDLANVAIARTNIGAHNASNLTVGTVSSALLPTNVALLSATTTSGPTNSASVLNGVVFAIRSGVTNISPGVSNAHPDFAVSNYGGKVYWYGVDSDNVIRLDSGTVQMRSQNSYLELADSGGHAKFKSYSTYTEIGPGISNASTYISFTPGGSEKHRMMPSGLFGIGHNAPWATAHITNVIASTTNILRVDGTNCMEAFTVKPNGDFSSLRDGVVKGQLTVTNGVIGRGTNTFDTLNVYSNSSFGAVTFGSGTITNLSFANSVNAPTVTGTAGCLWNSNQVLYWVTAAKITMISDGR